MKICRNKPIISNIIPKIVILNKIDIQDEN